MIIEALYRYYEILIKDPNVEIALPGYTAASINFALNLSQQGDLLDVFPFSTQVPQGKNIREIPSRAMVVPEQVKRTVGVAANFLWDNTAYVLGLSEKDLESPEYSSQRFEAFRKHNLALLANANCPAARAVEAFLQNYDPSTARTHPVLARHLDDLLKGGNLIFQVEGQYALDDPEIRRVWEEYQAGGQADVMQCLVSGLEEPIARLHPSIKGVRDAQATGASLVGFNERAYESYNRAKGQGLNSPVSQRVASGYGVALNYLLSPQNPNRKIYIGDATVVYWAESPDRRYGNVFAALLNPDYYEEQPDDSHAARREAEETLGQVAQKVQRGQALDVARLREGLDPNTRFYVLGLAPNAARLSVRFFLKDAFEAFVQRVLDHYEDLKIVKEHPNQPDHISIFKILNECVSPKITRREEEIKSTTSLMSGALMRSILTGAPYPESLYTTILTRIRIDGDDEDKHTRKINYVRAAVIKACLLRKYRRQSHNPFQEVLQMSLNDEFTHPAYVLGRLFAVLEKAQEEAIGKANASIKDRYFAAACTTPASVFPVLIRLSQYYVAKAEFGYSIDNRIQKLLNLLDVGPKAFPSRLSLDEQGIFILGYYHQRAAIYTKTGEESASASQSENN